MSLTAAEKITLFEITGEPVASIEEAVALIDSSIASDMETKLKAEVVTWNLNRDKVKLRIQGNKDGVNLVTQRLLDRITERVRLWLGFSSLNRINSSTSITTIGVWR